MRAAKPILALLLAVLALSVHIRCSSDPLSDGTETGNPELAVAVSMLFSALNDTAQWNARAYVPGGMDRLDSASIVSGAAYSHPDGVLAKRWTEQTDTVIGSMRYITTTIFIDDTVLLIDTTIAYDTIYVNDTLTETHGVFDTTMAVEDGDTTWIVRQRYETDSVFVTDTIVRADTAYSSDTLFVLDTIVIQDTIPADSTPTTGTKDTVWLSDSAVYHYAPGEPSSAGFDSLGIEYSRDSGANYILVRSMDTASLEYVAIDPANFRVDKTEATVLITKDLATSSGATITQQYADVDGDGTLFGTGTQAIRLLHSYWLPPDSVCAEVIFGNGADNSFATAGDNPVLKLVRNTWTDTRSEYVKYESPLSLGLSDTLSMERTERYPDSSLDYFIGTYRFVRGAAGVVNDDRLLRWTGSAVYNYDSDTLETLYIEVQFLEPVARGVVPSQAIVHLEAKLREHTFGDMDSALVDFDNRTVTGVYHKNGESFDVVVTYTCEGTQ